jgi:hypothetical protein
LVHEDTKVNIHYRVLSIDETECSLIVRYFTDELSEHDLRMDPSSPDTGSPERCRTDYNLTVWDQNISEQDLHDYIVRSAPHDWLKLKSTSKTKPPHMTVARALLGQVFTVKMAGPGEVDLTDRLPRAKENAVP